ncbi:hypothetical protein SteCoe_19974 [Stentor coeruleus]|uniref:Uncharacterized protein n=1 Tax=Stentor coeruleus TaxID=5963 RepID=A0A1R2BT08_9CILI|nr:hypothetical protein SteCoe_19974 [Stentor coeruleus]
MVSFLIVLVILAFGQSNPLELKSVDDLKNAKALSIDEIILAHPISTTIISLIFAAVLIVIMFKAYASWNASNEVKTIMRSKYLSSKEAKSLMAYEKSEDAEML